MRLIRPDEFRGVRSARLQVNTIAPGPAHRGRAASTPSQHPDTRPPWELLDSVDLVPTFRQRVSTYKFIPVEYRGTFRSVLQWALEALVQSRAAGPQAERQAWLLWSLLPRLPLRHHRAGAESRPQRQILVERFRKFWTGA